MSAWALEREVMISCVLTQALRPAFQAHVIAMSYLQSRTTQ